MQCDAVRDLFSELIDGELPDAVRARVEAHVAGCEACARDLRALRRTVRFVQANGATPIEARTPGAAYSEFTRAIVDESYGRAPEQVLVQQIFEALERGKGASS
jgi:anti-sigma factor RsiW